MGYSEIEKRFFQLAQRTGNGDRVKLWEYDVPGWTFHAKGLWANTGAFCTRHPWKSCPMQRIALLCNCTRRIRLDHLADFRMSREWPLQCH